MRNSTKQCPDCGSKRLIKLISMNKKICNNCNKEIEWKLDKYQKPMFD